MQESKKVGFCLPLDLIKRLEEAKWVRRKSLTGVLIEALTDYFNRHQITDQQKVPETAKFLAQSWPI